VLRTATDINRAGTSAFGACKGKARGALTKEPALGCLVQFNWVKIRLGAER